MTSYSTQPTSRLVGKCTCLLEEVSGSRVTRHASKDDTSEERRTTETVCSVNAASNLASSEQPGNRLAIRTEDAGLGVDLETTHGVVEDGGHEGDVEDVVHLPFTGLEELFAKWTLLSPYDVVVIVERSLELSRTDTHVLGESSTVFVALHETSTNVVFAVPFDLFRGFSVEDQPDWVLNTEGQWTSGEKAGYRMNLALLFPDLSSDIVAVLQLIDKSPALAVEQETTNAAEGLCSEELDFGRGFIWVNQAGRVHLDFLHIDGASAGRDGNLVSVTGTVIAVGGGKLPVLWAVFLEQGIFSKVGGITTSGQDYRAISGLGFSTKGVLDTNDSRTILDELGNASLLLNGNTFGVADREIFKALHLSVGDDLHKGWASATGTTEETIELTMPGNWASPRWVRG